jgi:DUF4097 and DUF4098 domain-containing protein YvlB
MGSVVTLRRHGARATICVLLLTASAGPADAFRLTERWERAFDAGQKPRLTVENVNGSIEVTGWDRPVIEVHAGITVKAASKDKARRIFEEIEFEVDHDPAGGVSVHARLPELRKDALRGEGNTTVAVEYTVRVPHRCDLDLVSVSGDIRASAVAGEFRLISGSGGIDLRSRGGRGELKSVNGSIGCRVETFDEGAELLIKTTNGDVELHLPPQASAELDAHTGNGRVRVGFDLSRVETKKRGRIIGTLGGGGGRISVRTKNGAITIGSL